MFLRNWYKALTATMYNKYQNADVTGKKISGSDGYFTSSSSSNSVYAHTSLTLVGEDGLSSNDYVPCMKNVRTSYDKGGVIFGNGDIAPEFDDYALSGSIVTTISVGAHVAVTHDDDGYTYVGTYTISNTSDTDITIKEVGLLLKRGNDTFLVERTVLEAPLTIPASGVGQLVYTIRMNYPTT